MVRKYETGKKEKHNGNKLLRIEDTVSHLDLSCFIFSDI